MSEGIPRVNSASSELNDFATEADGKKYYKVRYFIYFI
jgi:hypothetical protein